MVEGIRIDALPATHVPSRDQIVAAMLNGETLNLTVAQLLGLIVKADFIDQFAAVDITFASGEVVTATNVQDAINFLQAAKANTQDVATALSFKANTQDVNDALALKASKQELTDGLATKAGAQATTDALALKTDRTIAVRVDGAQAFSTAQKLQGAANLGVISRDVDQSASGLAAATKVNLLKNTLQAWEVVPGGIVNVTTDVAYLEWLNLEVYRNLRLSGIFRPNALAGLIAQVGTQNAPDTGSNYYRSNFAIQSTGLVHTLINPTTLLAITGSIESGLENAATFDALFTGFNKTRPTKVMSTFAGLRADTGYNIGTHAGAYKLNSACNYLRVYADNTGGTIVAGSEFILEGMRG